MEAGNLCAGLALNALGLGPVIIGGIAENVEEREGSQNFFNFLIFVIGTVGMGTLLGMPNGLTYNQTPAAYFGAFAATYALINLEIFGNIISKGLNAMSKKPRTIKGRDHDGWTAAIAVPLCAALWFIITFVDHEINTMGDIHDHFNHTAYTLSQNQLDALPVVQSVVVGLDGMITFFLFCSMVSGTAKAAAFMFAQVFTIANGWWRFYIAYWILSPAGANMDPSGVPAVAMVMIPAVALVVWTLVAAISKKSYGKIQIESFLPYPSSD
jgi:hypothetical protein